MKESPFSCSMCHGPECLGFPQASANTAVPVADVTFRTWAIAWATRHTKEGDNINYMHFRTCQKQYSMSVKGLNSKHSSHFESVDI